MSGKACGLWLCTPCTYFLLPFFMFEGTFSNIVPQFFNFKKAMLKNLVIIKRTILYTNLCLRTLIVYTSPLVLNEIQAVYILTIDPCGYIIFVIDKWCIWCCSSNLLHVVYEMFWKYKSDVSHNRFKFYVVLIHHSVCIFLASRVEFPQAAFCNIYLSIFFPQKIRFNNCCRLF